MSKFKIYIFAFLSVVIVAFVGLAVGCTEKEFFTVTYSCGDGGFLSGNNNQSVECGAETSEVEAIAREGFVFTGWNDGGTSAKRTDKDVKENKEFTAEFAQVVFTVTYESCSGGQIIGETVQKVSYGKDAESVKAVADEDYIFICWSDGIPTPERSDLNVVKNIIVKPLFAPKQWNASYSVNNSSAAKLTCGTRTVDLFEAAKTTVIPEIGYRFVCWSDGVTSPTRIDYYNGSDLEVQAIVEIDALDLPVMVINTEDFQEITSKEEYLNCNMSVLNAEEEYCFDSVTAGIRLRGNSTSGYPKKPLRVKFDKKQDLFGFGSYKSWVLLAMYQDFSSIKDFAAFDFAKSIKNENSAVFVPNARHVEVYLNNEYIGLYLLTDQIQENDGRVGVEENFDETFIEVPFLVEWDENAYNEGVEGVDWFRIVNEDSGVNSYYMIKYPETDQRYTQAQFDFIKNYIETVNSLCHNNSVTKEQFEEYIDLQAFIDYYLIQEFMGQGEINWKSIFMSRAIGGKLVMGPVWDFDWSATGPIGYGSNWGSTGWISNTNWFAYMMKAEWFFDDVCKRWNEISDILNGEIEYLKDFKSEIAAVAERNSILWDFIDDNNPINDFDGYYDKIMKYFEDRLNWINSQFSIHD